VWLVCLLGGVGVVFERGVYKSGQDDEFAIKSNKKF
jgi:hypothetical protein